MPRGEIQADIHVKVLCIVVAMIVPTIMVFGSGLDWAFSTHLYVLLAYHFCWLPAYRYQCN